jgi:hypothetical protein
MTLSLGALLLMLDNSVGPDNRSVQFSSKIPDTGVAASIASFD